MNFISDKIYNFEPDNIWFTSDTHFRDKKIIEHTNRPFQSVEEMDETLIDWWNKTVPEDGVIFHLGDFAQGGAKNWRSILRRLHGKKYLIMGNHDYRDFRMDYMRLFECFAPQMTINVGGQIIILNHVPFLCYGGEDDDVWQLFGHVHSGPDSKKGKDLPRLEMLFPRQYDVGVDNNGFMPISFVEVKAKIEAQVESLAHCSG